MGSAITFKKWLQQDEEYQQILRDAEETEEINSSARRKFMRMRLINACATFFPDMPEIEGWILVGVRSL